MAESVLGRVPSRRFTLTGSYSPALSRAASREAARKYRSACRRARRAVFARSAGRLMSSFLSALSKLTAPLRGVTDFFVYAAAPVRYAVRVGNFRCISARDAGAHKKTNHLRTNTALAFLAAGVLIFSASIFQVGLEVILDGESIGYVGSQSVVESSLSAVSERAGEILGRPYTVSPDIRYRFSIVSKHRIFDSKEVEESLLNSVSDIDRLCVLTVDGGVVAASRSPSDLQGVLDIILSQYPPEGHKAFCQDVKIQSQLASVSLIRDPSELLPYLTANVRDEIRVTLTERDTAESVAAAHGLSADALRVLNPGVDFDALTPGQSLLIQKHRPFLSVAYSEKVSYTQAVAYSTEHINDPNLWLGETKVVTEGVDGEELVMARQVSVDGYTPDTDVEGSFITLDPVTEIIAHGTRTREVTGSFIRPHNGRAGSGFGRRFIFGSYSNHYGLDIAGRTGDSIVASDGGYVSFTGYDGNYGLCVRIDHKNGYVTVYGHCSKILVEEGQQVGQGEEIALVGNTGRSTGPHVHFEVRVNGVAKNPNNYLKG